MDERKSALTGSETLKIPNISTTTVKSYENETYISMSLIANIKPIFQKMAEKSRGFMKFPQREQITGC